MYTEAIVSAVPWFESPSEPNAACHVLTILSIKGLKVTFKTFIT